MDPLLCLSSDSHLEQGQAWIFGDPFGKLDFRKRREWEVTVLQESRFCKIKTFVELGGINGCTTV